MKKDILPELANNPVFIIGAHKSGSSYLRGLLDGHPSLTVIPLEAHFFKHANYWIDYSYRRSRPPGGRELASSAIDELSAYTSQENPYSDLPAGGSIDLPQFQQVMGLARNTSSERKLFDTYIGALLLSLDLTSDLSTELRIVEKSVENAEFATDLKRLFPDAKFVHIIRNPYDNLSSFRRYRQKVENRYPRIDRMVLSLNNHYYNLERNIRNVDDYLVIKYEDLVRSPKSQMKKIAKHIEIEFNDTLLKPTTNGKHWKSNTTRSEGDVNDVKNLEIFYVNKLFKSILGTYGYEKRKFSGKYWARIKREPVKNYIFNRLIRYSL